VLTLRLSVEQARASGFTEALAGSGGVRRLVAVPAELPADEVVLTADIPPADADRVLAVLKQLEVSDDQYVLARAEVIAPMPLTKGRVEGDEFAWAEVIGQARAHSRPIARYMALMAVAAVIAALGVITSNGILIVGAMAVSPDLLPICAICVGIVGGRQRLAGRALFTLLIGLILIAVLATVLTLVLSLTGILSSTFDVRQGGLHGLADTDYSTVLVAAAAGVAAMLSFETRASAAVGVAISVTTIPASAFFGVAWGNGQTDEALGALAVLGVNVLLLIISGSLTLALQRALVDRRDVNSVT
jgi:uncharacterized hydrophobic protein (TIGR00271 family)